MRRRTRPATILCAVDFSDTSPATLSSAAELARRTGAPLTVLHVIEAWNWPELRAVGANYDALPPVPREMARSANRRLAALVSAHVAPAVDATTRLSFGVPSLEIERLAYEVGALYLVVGAHSRRLLGQSFLGSTAQQLLAAPPCSILLARPAPSHASQLSPASERSSSRKSDAFADRKEAHDAPDPARSGRDRPHA
jgi:universal stress protein A